MFSNIFGIPVLRNPTLAAPQNTHPDSDLADATTVEPAIAGPKAIPKATPKANRPKMRRKLFGYSRSDSKSDGFLMPPEIRPKTARKLLKRAVNQFCFLKFSGRFRADFRTDFRADFRAQFRAHRSGSIFKFSGEPFLDQLGASFWLSFLGLNTACESPSISTSLWKSTVAPNLFK